MKKKIFAVFVVLFCFVISGSADKIPMKPADLYKIRKVSDPRLAPDGTQIAYTVSVPSLKENKHNSDIYLISTAGGKPEQLTARPGRDSSPRWSPDGTQIAFISNRDGTANIYLIPVKGGEARKLTASKTGLSSPIWSRDGRHILCKSRVLPKGKKNLENRTKEELPKCEARTIDRLLFRQWDAWLGDERNHLFLVDCKDGSMKELTPGDYDVPPVSLSGAHDFDISPDGREICFVRNDDPLPAISTNHDIFLLAVATLKETKLTTNKALDTQPHYSPDGRYIAYAGMKKAGYEADRERLFIYDRKTETHTNLTEKLDRSIGAITWNPDSKKIYFTCRDQGRGSIYRVDLKGNIRKITDSGYNVRPAVTPDGKKLVFLRSYNHMPYEVFTMAAGSKKVRQLTFENAGFLARYDLPKLEDFWFAGAGNTKVHGFIQRPPGFEPGKKYPVVLTIHGGPQNMWSDRFMTTWFTFQLISSPGYVGVFINPRGSSGYGSLFREQVSKDYGGRCYTDLMNGLDYVLENYDFVDKERLAAVGGSFGGYSVNWINGHSDRFKCIVSHAGLYNLVSFYGATEELWYPARDMGETPWDEPGVYAQWSPHLHAKKFKTPTLVIHGECDYRVPFAESLQLFTALQRRGVPSRLVVFPGEGHVISGPQNNVRWWREMHRWLAEYL
ncbi:MAG: S9 family peptidase [Candidatus Aminicenantes bacterium]|nr:S9 family peptidase [Candidatus Aminicenantes bacterium]